VDALDGVPRELLGPPRRRLLYVPDVRAADEVGVAAPGAPLAGTGLRPKDLLEPVQEPRHACGVPGRRARTTLAHRAKTSWTTSSDVIATAQNRWSRQIDHASRVWTSGGSARRASRTAFGKVRTPASTIGAPASPSEVQPTQFGASAPAGCTTVGASAAPMARTTSGFSGRAVAVTLL